MTLPKVLALLAVVLFSVIGFVALFKDQALVPSSSALTQIPLEVELDQEIQVITPVLGSNSEKVVVHPEKKEHTSVTIDLPEANRIGELFDKNGPKLPIVETLTYKSHVPWQKGRPAWLSDYAAHYETSRHFIARSLNGKPDYFKQELAEGDRFNVLRKDKNFEFHFVVDTSRCRLWFYYVDLDSKQKVLLKTCPVGLGRLDASKSSGLLTPLGTYTLGNRIAVYKPKIMGTYHGVKTEMITVFGTRWIPFDQEVGSCTESAKGFGIHGTPWVLGPKGEFAENLASIGKYEGDGCIRLASSDMEELFAIVITKPTKIEIVRDFSESALAGMNP